MTEKKLLVMPPREVMIYHILTSLGYFPYTIKLNLELLKTPAIALFSVSIFKLVLVSAPSCSSYSCKSQSSFVHVVWQISGQWVGV